MVRRWWLAVIPGGYDVRFCRHGRRRQSKNDDHQRHHRPTVCADDGYSKIRMRKRLASGRALNGPGLSQNELDSLCNLIVSHGASGKNLASLPKAFINNPPVAILSGPGTKTVPSPNLAATIESSIVNRASVEQRIDYIQALRLEIERQDGVAAVVGTVLLSFQGQRQGVKQAFGLFSSSPGELSAVLAADNGKLSMKPRRHRRRLHTGDSISGRYASTYRDRESIMVQEGDKALLTRLFALLRLGPDGRDNYVYDAPHAHNLGYFVEAVQNAVTDLGTADNYSLVADTANALLGSIPYGAAATTSLVSAWAANAQNNAENTAYTAEQRVAEDAIYDQKTDQQTDFIRASRSRYRSRSVLELHTRVTGVKPKGVPPV